ncbi:MAG: hypothetical protein ACOX6H_02185 [Christensenellales bacterium]|jgi:hypothetical protein
MTKEEEMKEMLELIDSLDSYASEEENTITLNNFFAESMKAEENFLKEKIELAIKLKQAQKNKAKQQKQKDDREM